MAQSLYQLAVELQGKCDSTFGTSINEATKHLNEMNNEISLVCKGQENISLLAASYVKLSAASAKYGESIHKLTRKQADIIGYQKQEAASLKSVDSLKNLCRTIQWLESVYGPLSKEQEKTLASARKELDWWCLPGLNFNFEHYL
ncbi:hypothetical protein [Cloacibacillus sp.]|uniref:hypothetical protein n=1 Tax=Cloacibacillus sp. TaxID=2049023 RepID=UPI0025C639C3|nr:hypothetical protein [Cloacibacillus sp.]MCC8057444.1 hypothetical protein [Cloacibacillus sp.]